MAFTRPVDIANRACQHIGAQRILTADFSEVSQQASEIGACYDNLRQDELRRNIWNFAVRRNVLRPLDLGAVVWTPPTYAAGTTYALGAVVVDSSGVWWQSLQAGNVGNTPPLAGAASSAFWTNYFGPDYADPFDYTLKTAYYAGEIVVVPAAWSNVTTYAINSIVNYTDGNYYVSLTNSNTGNTPSTSTVNWMLYQTWLAQNPTPLSPPVYVGTPSVYLSLTNGNTAATTAASWVSVAGTVANLQVLYPIGAGPATNAQTLNAFRLPHGFLRRAPRDPKSQVNTWLGAPHGTARSDWILENGYIISSEFSPLTVRYIADFQDVSRMDAMFCEGLAARIGMEISERVADDKAGFKKCEGEYKRIMGDARLVNSIENGASDPPLDPYIICRV